METVIDCTAYKILVFKFRVIKCAGCVERVIKMKCSYKIIVLKSGEMVSCMEHGRLYKYNVKNEFWKEIIGCIVD